MLEVRDIVAGYGEAVVVRGVSLEVPDGRLVALLGANGVGKTTLLRTIAGVVKARTGTVVFRNEDITALPLHQRARRGLCHIADGRAIFPSLTVRENLYLHAEKGNEAEAVEKAAAAFPVLGMRLQQVAGTLSGGEQQMLALVRAYVREVKLVLVDEASMGLAPLVVDRIYEFLMQLVAEGTSILLVEQYVTRALEIADTAYILNKGTMVYHGPASDLVGEDIFSRYLGIEIAAGA